MSRKNSRKGNFSVNIQNNKQKKQEQIQNAKKKKFWMLKMKKKSLKNIP